MDPKAEFLKELSNLNTWIRRGIRAPHKPLYLLLLIGRAQASLPRMVSFSDIQSELRDALKIFGPTRKSCHPEYPFWHLAQDKSSLCEVVGDSPISVRPNSSNPSSKELIKRNAFGGLRDCYFKTLQDLNFASTATHKILDSHFPSLLHSDILNFFKIKIDDVHAHDRDETWKFRKRLIESYNGTCCITGMQTSYGSEFPGLEGVHLCWPQAGGNDDESNGLLINTLHAKLFSMGFIGVTGDFKLMISPHLKRNASFLLDERKSLLLPREKSHWPNQNGLEWHRTQVFKS
jgi:putative restriction endonuclease